MRRRRPAAVQHGGVGPQQAGTPARGAPRPNSHGQGPPGGALRGPAAWVRLKRRRSSTKAKDRPRTGPVEASWTPLAAVKDALFWPSKCAITYSNVFVCKSKGTGIQGVVPRSSFWASLRPTPIFFELWHTLNVKISVFFELGPPLVPLAVHHTPPHCNIGFTVHPSPHEAPFQSPRGCICVYRKRLVCLVTTRARRAVGAACAGTHDCRQVNYFISENPPSLCVARLCSRLSVPSRHTHLKIWSWAMILCTSDTEYTMALFTPTGKKQKIVRDDGCRGDRQPIMSSDLVTTTGGTIPGRPYQEERKDHMEQCGGVDGVAARLRWPTVPLCDCRMLW